MVTNCFELFSDLERLGVSGDVVIFFENIAILNSIVLLLFCFWARYGVCKVEPSEYCCTHPYHLFLESAEALRGICFRSWI